MIKFICFIVVALLATRVHAQNNYALVIGISGYPNYDDEKKLRFADKDAESFKEFISSPQGGAFNVTILTNGAASRTQITKAIKELGRKVKPEDRFFLFYSGHGEVADNGRAYFMPHDADPTLPTDRGFRMDDFLEEVTNRINAKMIVFFADACHSGSSMNAGADAQKGDEEAFTAKLNKQWSDMFKNKGNSFVAISSSSSNQSSYEDHDLKHGIFTYYLIEGLKGKADQSSIAPDGTVRAEELRHYLDEKVGGHAMDHLKKKQNPHWSPNFDPEIPFSVYDVAAKRDKEFRSLSDSAYQLINKTEYHQAISLYNQALRINPNSKVAHNNVGVCYERQKNYGMAIEEYSRCIELDPNYVLALRNRALVNNRLLQYDKAEKDCLKILEHRRDTTALLMMSGFCHDLHFDFERAYQYSKAGFEVKASESAVANLAETALTLGKYTETDSICSVADFPKDAELRCVMRFVALASAVAGGQSQDRIQFHFKNLLTSIDLWPPKLKLDWDFAGTRKYIIDQKMTPDDKRMLLASIALFSYPKSKETKVGYQTMLTGQYASIAGLHWKNP